MKLSLKTIIFINIFVLFLWVKPVQAEVLNDFTSWNTLYITSPITEKIKFMLDVSGRFTPGEYNNVLVVRPALGYEPIMGLSFWAGYAYFDQHPSDGYFENRAHQDIIYIKDLSRVTLQNRIRFEERFFTGIDEEDIACRGRYALKAFIPVIKSKKLSLVLGEEVFINFNDALYGSIRAGYGQNRIFTGVNYKLNNFAAFETGYQLQHTNIPNGGSDRLNHAVVATIYLTTPQLIKK